MLTSDGLANIGKWWQVQSNGLSMLETREMPKVHQSA